MENLFFIIGPGVRVPKDSLNDGECGLNPGLYLRKETVMEAVAPVGYSYEYQFLRRTTPRERRYLCRWKGIRNGTSIFWGGTRQPKFRKVKNPFNSDEVLLCLSWDADTLEEKRVYSRTANGCILRKRGAKIFGTIRSIDREKFQITYDCGDNGLWVQGYAAEEGFLYATSGWRQ